MKHSATVIGLDIAKNVFYAVGNDERGDVSEILCKRSGESQIQFNDAVNRSPKTMAN
jgi:hypothetical protein